MIQCDEASLPQSLHSYEASANANEEEDEEDSTHQVNKEAVILQPRPLRTKAKSLKDDKYSPYTTPQPKIQQASFDANDPKIKTLEPLKRQSKTRKPIISKQLAPSVGNDEEEVRLGSAELRFKEE